MRKTLLENFSSSKSPNSRRKDDVRLDYSGLVSLDDLKVNITVRSRVSHFSDRVKSRAESGSRGGVEVGVDLRLHEYGTLNKRVSTYSVSGVFSPSVICQDASATGLDQERPVTTLLLPLLHTFQDGPHTSKVVGVRTGDDDIVVGSGISELVILFE